VDHSKILDRMELARVPLKLLQIKKKEAELRKDDILETRFKIGQEVVIDGRKARIEAVYRGHS